MRTPRLREAGWLLVVGIAVAIAYGTVYLASSKVLSADGLVWGGTFLAFLLAAHLVVRRAIPLADPWLLPIAGLLTGLGITMTYRLIPDLAGKQTGWFLVSLVLLGALVTLLPDHHVLERYKYVIGAGSVLALLVTISPLGKEVNGSQLWIDFGPAQIQPGEFAKIGIVVFLAAYLRENRELLAQRFSPKHLGPLVLLFGLSLALLVRMNDFGTSLLFFTSFLLLVYVATGRAWYPITGLTAFAGGAYAVYHVATHVRQRFDTWLDPWSDPAGAGYQSLQALYSLADGGLLGRGLGQAYVVTESGRTLIPEAQTDYVFAIIGNELGFVGAVGILLCYVLFTWRGFAIAAACRDGFSKLLAFGLSAVFAIQAIIIVGGVVRLLPLTGQTLPFVSYGGSSLLANWLLVGLLLIVSHHARVERERETEYQRDAFFGDAGAVGGAAS
ncbi:MAG: FtsW/RodA/SpoVE family cell cycle protein [Thermoleophilia bacterium]|nr:FtsW/RodA/SpoVE family cell cycle protein [Thermoleophilia bacterium]